MIRSVLILMLLALPAYAEDIVAYQVEGDAPSSASDPRLMALDEAFGRAVDTALGEIVPGDARTTHKGELDKEIIGHARVWVAKYAVTKDETVDGQRELTVSVRIDRDKLRARLGELAIPTMAPGSGGTPPSSGDPVAPVKTITILVRIATPGGAMRADFGPAADANTPGVSALTTLLRNAGFAVRRAPASGDAKGGLSDDDALALASDAKADTVVVAGVTVGEAVPVRGVATTAALVTADLRVVDRSKKVIGQAAGTSAARGDDQGYAIDRALLAAASDALPPPPQKLAQAASFHGDDTPIAEPGIVLVRLPAKTTYSLVIAEQKFLAGAKNIKAASLRRLSPGGWVIGVTTSESTEQVARIAKKAPATDVTSAVKIVGDVVEVTLSGAP